MKPSLILKSLLAGALGIALVIGLFILTGVSLATLGDLFANLNSMAFTSFTVCSFLYVVLGGMKWHLIAGVREPRRFFYMHYTAQAMLLGQFLPTPVAIAVNRAAVMKLRQNATVKKGLLNAVYDMGFDFIAAAILIPASLLQWYYHFDFWVWLALGTVTIIAASGVFMIAPKVLPARWLKKPWLAEERKRGLLSSRLIGLMMVFSTARFIVFVARFILGAVAAHIDIPATVIAYATPPATMSALMVVTPANLGIAEWSWTYLLHLWGVALATGAIWTLSFRILLFASQVIVAAICWALYAMGGKRPTSKF